jgi:hypothetical protein
MPADTKTDLIRTLRGVALLTSASGALQMLQPGWVLGQLSAERSALARHLFGTVGMFMTVSGATLHRSLAPAKPDRRLLVWAALQKLGASAAVGIGVRHRLFSRRALAVAGFDLASGLACLVCARQVAASSTER